MLFMLRAIVEKSKSTLSMILTAVGSDRSGWSFLVSTARPQRGRNMVFCTSPSGIAIFSVMGSRVSMIESCCFMFYRNGMTGATDER